MGSLAFAFGAVLKVSDLLQEHGYRWFRGSATAMGALATALLLVVLRQSDDLGRIFWLAVLLHWILRGRIDGLNHGLFATASLVALGLWDPLLLHRGLVPFAYFFALFTVLGVVHDSYQYEADLAGPPWVKTFFRNQHLYWYMVIAGHLLVAPLNVALAVVGYAFVKGYGVFYSERACAELRRVGIVPPA